MHEDEYIQIGETRKHASAVTWDDLCNTSTLVPIGFRYDLLTEDCRRGRDEAAKRLTAFARKYGGLEANL